MHINKHGTLCTVMCHLLDGIPLGCWEGDAKRSSDSSSALKDASEAVSSAADDSVALGRSTAGAGLQHIFGISC